MEATVFPEHPSMYHIPEDSIFYSYLHDVLFTPTHALFHTTLYQSFK